MRCRNHFEMLIGAGLLGLASLVVAPRLYGGGGDEGVDILPATGADGPSGRIKDQRSYLTIHGKFLQLSNDGVPLSSGLVTAPHTHDDLYVGMPGTEPDPTAAALDILAKGKRTLSWCEILPQPGSQSPTAIHLAGRFEVEDLDPLDGETLDLVSAAHGMAIKGVLLGHRSTHEGGIAQSFKSIDYVGFSYVPRGSVDLVAARVEAKALLSGTGYDVGIVLVTPFRRKIEESWVAWNVDDAAALYDLEIRTR